jgi:hypothetical protein
MSKKDEALKLALEALGLYQAAGFGDSTDFNKQHEAFYKAQTAITAIKQARSAPLQDSDHEFKNFHRLLCERFGYTHDEVDWKRDQISLIEWIAKQVKPAAPVQPVAVDQATMELAESVGLIGPASRTHDLHAAIQRFHDLICVNATMKAAKMAADAIREATSSASPVQETAGWKWHQAPVKTSWGHKMVVADLAIDKDNTVSVYCERDQTTKVEAMFNPPAQPAAPLTDDQIEKKFKSRFGEDSWRVIGAFYYEGHRDSEAAHGITKGEA